MSGATGSSSSSSIPNLGSGAIGEFAIGVSPIGGVAGYTPAGSDILLEAFEMCGIRGNAITAEQFISARRSMNLVIMDWANRGINLWKVEKFEFLLRPGEEQYPLDPGTIDVLDVYRRIGSDPHATVPPPGAFPGDNLVPAKMLPTDIMLYPLSRSEYARIPNKFQQAPPTSYWFERSASPQIHLWPAPDPHAVYTLVMYAMYRIDDADPTMGRATDIHYRFLPVYTLEVAAHVALKWAPAKFQVLAQLAATKWLEASAEDREKVPHRINPDFSAYYRY